MVKDYVLLMDPKLDVRELNILNQLTLQNSWSFLVFVFYKGKLGFQKYEISFQNIIYIIIQFSQAPCQDVDSNKF